MLNQQNLCSLSSQQNDDGETLKISKVCGVVLTAVGATCVHHICYLFSLTNPYEEIILVINKTAESL